MARTPPTAPATRVRSKAVPKRHLSPHFEETNVRRLSFRNSDAFAWTLFLCPAPIPSRDFPVGTYRVGGMAGSAHRIGSVLPMFTLAGVVVYWASFIPPIHDHGTMTSADFSTITQRIAAHGAAALAAACSRDLPR